MHSNCLLLVDSDVVVGGSVEEVAEGGVEWMAVSAGVVDGCCERGIVDVFPPVRGSCRAPMMRTEKRRCPILVP